MTTTIPLSDETVLALAKATTDVIYALGKINPNLNILADAIKRREQGQKQHADVHLPQLEGEVLHLITGGNPQINIHMALEELVAILERIKPSAV